MGHLTKKGGSDYDGAGNQENTAGIASAVIESEGESEGARRTNRGYQNWNDAGRCCARRAALKNLKKGPATAGLLKIKKSLGVFIIIDKLTYQEYYFETKRRRGYQNWNDAGRCWELCK